MKPLVPATVSLLTPPGRGAVAVIAVAGPAAVDLVERFFRAKSGPLADRAANRIAYGKWGAEPAEDVVACRRNADFVEIHGHGGVAAVRRIVGDLTTAGALEEPWTNHVRRRENSSIRSAACVALSKAVTQRAAVTLLDQYHGALENAVHTIVAQLAGNQLGPAKSNLDALLARASLGLHLTQPWQVVVAGPPNVGKSSLINALLGYRRAIVFDQPGTTRDVVTAQTALDGWPVQLADTAGLRAAGDELEAAGVERAVSQAAAADCLILVFDATQPWTHESERLSESWPNALLVHNKCDLAAPTAGGLAVSARTGAGVEQLIGAIVAQLVPIVPSPAYAMPFTAEQLEVLQSAVQYLERSDLPLAVAALQTMLGTPSANG